MIWFYWRLQNVANLFNTSTNTNHLGRFSVAASRCSQRKNRTGPGLFNGKAERLQQKRIQKRQYFTRAIVSLRFPRHFIWTTNLTYNRSVSNLGRAVDFTIWNANLSYRLLKGDNGEIMLSALDLLGRNKGVINTSEGNLQNFGYSNVRRQYFLLTFSYHPRKFGN